MSTKILHRFSTIYGKKNCFRIMLPHDANMKYCQREIRSHCAYEEAEIESGREEAVLRSRRQWEEGHVTGLRGGVGKLL